MKANLKRPIRALGLTLALLLALLSPLTLLSPLSLRAEAEAEEETADEGTTSKVIFWHSMTDETAQALDAIVEDYNQNQGQEKGIEVEAVFQGSYTDASTKLRTILQADQPSELPDVMQIDATGIMSYKTAPYRYTVDQAMEDFPGFEIDKLLDVPRAYWNFDGIQMGLPFSTSTTVTFYNKDLLKEAGFEEAPTTFQEIIDLASKLPETNAEGKDLYAYGGVPNTPTLANWIGQIPGEDADSSYVLDNLNGRGGVATEVICDDEGTLQRFLEGWKAMYDEGALLNESEGLIDLFLAQRLAMITASSSALATLTERVGDDFELGVGFYPRVDEEANFGATVSGSGVFLFDRAEGANLEAAWDFAQYLVSPKVQADFSIQSGYFPSHEDSYEEADFVAYTDENPALLTCVDQVRQTSPDMMGIIVGPSWDFYMEIQDICFTMLDEDVSVEETAQTLDEVLTDLLTSYNEAETENEG